MILTNDKSNLKQKSCILTLWHQKFLNNNWTLNSLWHDYLFADIWRLAKQILTYLTKLNTFWQTTSIKTYLWQIDKQPTTKNSSDKLYWNEIMLCIHYLLTKFTYWQTYWLSSYAILCLNVRKIISQTKCSSPNDISSFIITNTNDNRTKNIDNSFLYNK